MRNPRPDQAFSFDRRQLLLCGSALVAGLALRAGRARGAEGALFVSCRVDAANGHHLTGIDQAGHVRFDLPLPERGHGAAFRPGADEGVVFARRPGTFAVAFDPIAGVALRRIDAARGRHFYGHGAFSPDGRYLFTSENDYEAGRGVLGVRDAADGYRQIGEFPSHGVGPHELLLMPDGATLVVANGGILTHPDRDRAKLNLDSMAPSLAYLDLADGKLRADYRLAEKRHQLSIRHLAVLGSGGVAIAMQYEGDMQDRVPLVGIHDGDRIRLLEAPPGVQAQMRQYCGSVAADRSGSLIAVSAPRGNLVTFWDAADGSYLTSTMLADGCGVAPTDQEGAFLITSGVGQVMRFEPRTGRRTMVAVTELQDTGWDNHLRMTALHL
jgi:uncharacterized protein